jgi:hypothetical protein
MKKLTYGIFLFLAFLPVSAQITVNEFKNTLKTTQRDVIGIVPFENTINGLYNVVVLDTKRAYAYLFDENHNLVDSLATEDRERKYKKILGYSIANGRDFRAYLSNDKTNSFAIADFNFTTRTVGYRPVKFKLPKGKIIQTFTYENVFYIMTLAKNSSVVGFHKFNGGDYSVVKIDMSGELFMDENSKSTSLYRAFGSALTNPIATKIEPSTPNSIEQSSNGNKLYIFNNKLYLTLDTNREACQLIEIDLDSFTYNLKQYYHPNLITTGFKNTSNSFLTADYLYLLNANSQQMIFQVIERETGNLLKELKANRDEKITFMNTPIIQEGGTYDKYRELDKTKQYLRKLSGSKLGISPYFLNGLHLITFGGVKETAQAPMMMPFGGIPLGSFAVGGLTFNAFFNPAFMAYNSYANTKSTYFTTVLDMDFEHIEGKVPVNMYDKIDTYLDDNAVEIQTVFKYRGGIYVIHKQGNSPNYKMLLFKDY